jgi:hypothetical protein
LHWGLTPKSFPFALGFEDLWTRRQSVRLGGQSIQTFSNEDLLLYLCVHGAKHYWRRLEWIAAVAELIRGSAKIDWPVVLRRARETNCRNIMSVGLLLACNTFNLELPSEIQELARTSPQSQACALRLKHTLFENMGATPTQLEMFRWNLPFMDRKRDVIRGFLGSIFVPTISDWQAVHLPDALYPLYYGLRPIRLLSKYGGGRRNDAPEDGSQDPSNKA